MDDLIEVLAEPRRPSRGVLRHATLLVPCALGRGGVRADKREGDGATPLGTFPLRRLWYRADRLEAPATNALPIRPIRGEDGCATIPTRPSTTGRSPCRIRRGTNGCGVTMRCTT